MNDEPTDTASGMSPVSMYTPADSYCGYRRSASGARQRAFFYLGTIENAAVKKAAALKYEWGQIKRKEGQSAVWSLGNEIAPHHSLARLPPERIDAAIEQHHAEMTEQAIDNGEVDWQTPRLRIEQVREKYLEYRKGKLGIGGGQGIDDKTYSNECRNLKAGLAPIDGRILIGSFGYAEIERLRDDIFRRVGDADNCISKRTANNYWNEVRRMLDWAHRQSNVDYRHPQDAGDLFKRRFRNPNPVKIAEYDAAQLKRLLKPATDRQRLYIYLALNCGYYQVDIGTLRRDEIVPYEGQMAITRKRSKTLHQNDFEAMHTLWPETAALLKRETAKSARFADGPKDWALLTERGTPLYRKSPQCDIVGDSYLALRQGAEIDLPFKQFRKIGATAMQRLGGDETRRLYKAGTIDSGDKVYVREAWEKLTPHLNAWGDELRRDGVLYDRAPVGSRRRRQSLSLQRSRAHLNKVA